MILSGLLEDVIMIRRQSAIVVGRARVRLHNGNITLTAQPLSRQDISDGENAVAFYFAQVRITVVGLSPME